MIEILILIGYCTACVVTVFSILWVLTRFESIKNVKHEVEENDKNINSELELLEQKLAAIEAELEAIEYEFEVIEGTFGEIDIELELIYELIGKDDTDDTDEE